LKTYQWIILIVAAVWLGMWIQSKMQPVLALPSLVGRLEERMDALEKQQQVPERRWRFVNRAAEFVRRLLPW
jgi:hypothetical protein